MKLRTLLLGTALACTPAPDDLAANSTSTGETPAPGSTSTGGGEPAEIPLIYDPGIFALDDLDRDGHVDLLLHTGGAVVQLRRGRGDGTFVEPLELGLADDTNVGPIAVGDLDGDTRRDVLSLESTLLLLQDALNQPLGAATHVPDIRFDVPAMVVVDATADGMDDVFVVGRGLLYRFHGTPSGGLQRQAEVGLGGEPRAIAAADFDADGLIDLAIANSGSNDVSLLRGRGEDGFAPQSLLPVAESPSDLAAADLDGDGTLDLAVLGRTWIAGLRGHGDLKFAAPAGIGLPENRGLRPLVLCDRDGDPFPDALVLFEDGSILELHGSKDTRFGAPRYLLRNETIREIACADLDEDGIGDLVFSTSSIKETPRFSLRFLLSSVD